MSTLEFVPQKSPAPTPPVADRRDRSAQWVGLIATVVSISAFAVFKHAGATLAYKDALSHLIIARRVFDSPTPGFAQLGGVWLPLPHLLMLPLIWIDPLYYGGYAGSIISMAAYVATSVLLYKIVYTLTNGSRTAGIVGALFFMLNPSVLYMQSTPMTELLLFACLTAMVYGLQRWIQTAEYTYLLSAGGAALAGTLTRYEAWVLTATLLCVVGVVCWRQRFTYKQSEGTVLAFAMVALAGIAGWLLWNQLIFGNALNFQDGAYAKPSLWVGSADRAVGNWSIALQTYWYAIVDNLGTAGTVVALICLVVMVIRERLSLQMLPALSLLTFVPFFVMSLEKGQRPLHVTQVGGDLYNVRFGLLLVLPAAIFVGYLAGSLNRARFGAHIVRVGVGVILVAGLVAIGHPNQIATLREPRAFLAADSNNRYSDEVSSYLRQHYAGGKILMESFGNETILEKAHIDLVNNVYEGSYHQWDAALADPSGTAMKWIVMRRTPGNTDLVYATLRGSSALAQYQNVHSNVDYDVYEAR